MFPRFRDCSLVSRQKEEKERRTRPLLRRDPDATVHPVEKLPGDIEAEAGALDSGGTQRLEAIELLEDPRLLVVGNADPLVAD